MVCPILDECPSLPPPEKRARMLQPEDIAACLIMAAKLPARAVVPEQVIAPPYMMLDWMDRYGCSSKRTGEMHISPLFLL